MTPNLQSSGDCDTRFRAVAMFLTAGWELVDDIDPIAYNPPFGGPKSAG